MNKAIKFSDSVYKILFFAGFIWLNLATAFSQNSTKSSNAVMRPVSEVIGIAHVDGRYNFTNKPFLIEGSDEILKLGSKCIKVWFNDVDHKYIFNSKWPSNVDKLNYTELSKTPYFKKLFSMPFKVYSLEMTDGNLNMEWRDGLTKAESKIVNDEYYSFTKYLLTTYRNTGKTFILQNWEADGHLATRDHSASQTKIAVQGMIDWTNARQDGVDRARKEIKMEGVTVVNAFEVSMVLGSWTPPPYAIDVVVPFTHNDLYSYSSYSSRSLDKLNTIVQRLKYIESKTPPSKMYGKQNLMIGEFGYEERQIPDNKNVNDSTASVQLLSVKTQLQYLLDWGVVYIFYWEIYCNEINDKSSNVGIAVHDNKQYKGFWLRRADGSFTPTYRYLKEMFKENKPVKTYAQFIESN
jgi:hypothetical protein